MASHTILAIDDSQTFTRMLSIVLGQAGYHVVVENSGIAAMRWIRTSGVVPDLVVVDLNMPDMDGIAVVKRLREKPETAATPVIMLTASSERNKIVACIQAGANAYMIKPFNGTELLQRVELLLPRVTAHGAAVSGEAEAGAVALAPASELKAAVFTVFSLKGGTGVTAVGVNLAVALALLWAKPVPLIDLAVSKNHCQTMLNLQPAYAFTCFSQNPNERISDSLVRERFAGYKSLVTLFPAALAYTTDAAIPGDALERLWTYLKPGYPFVVVDAENELGGNTLTMLNRSQAILLLITPDRPSVQSAVEALKFFNQMNYGEAKVLLVLNQAAGQSGLSPKEIETALNRKLAYTIPYDPEAMIQAINTGQPVVAANAQSASAQAIARIAYDLSPAEYKAAPPAEVSPLLASFLKP